MGGHLIRDVSIRFWSYGLEDALHHFELYRIMDTVDQTDPLLLAKARMLSEFFLTANYEVWSMAKGE